MNKSPTGVVAPRVPGQTATGDAARATNATPWEPPPGMVKRWCRRCGYAYAAANRPSPAICPSCTARLRG